MCWMQSDKEREKERRICDCEESKVESQEGTGTGANKTVVGVNAARWVEERLPREPRKMEINYIYT